jgi:hypothetical protein
VVLPDSHGISRAPCYLGSPPPGRTISSTGLTPSTVRLSMRFDYDTAFLLAEELSDSSRRSHNPVRATPDSLTRARFGLIRFRSPLLTEYLFLPVLRCFTSRRSLHAPYIFRCGSQHMTAAGFPHSDILGSRFVCQLPEAYRRLRRPSSAPSAKASTLCP